MGKTASAQPVVTSKQLLGHDPLKEWDSFKQELHKEVTSLLNLGRRVSNSRMKFLARILQSVVNRAKTNTELPNLADENRAFKTELALEERTDIANCEKQKKLIGKLWAIVTKNNKLSSLGDPFIKERINFISSVIGSYQAGSLCVEYPNLLSTHNQTMALLRSEYGYLSIKKEKKTKDEADAVMVSDLVPMESCAV